jgi:hypothetical protein
MRSKLYDSFGDVKKYDMRRPTWPHSGKNSSAAQEGYPIMGKLPKRNSYCPCGTPSIDVQYLDMDQETKQPVLKNAAMPESYRNCCESKNREWEGSVLEQLQREAEEITE